MTTCPSPTKLMHPTYILMRGIGQTEPEKIRDVDVSVKDPNGFEYFIACPHGNVETELDRLVDWLNNSPFDEFATATAFFHEFESIHPFEDGNGRTGRVFFQAILRELGLKNCGLCKFEEKLLSDTGTYYNMLAYTDMTANYTPLIHYVVESLHEVYREAIDTFSEGSSLQHGREHAQTRDEGKGDRELQPPGSLRMGHPRRSLHQKQTGHIGQTRHPRKGKEDPQHALCILDPFRDLKKSADIYNEQRMEPRVQD